VGDGAGRRRHQVSARRDEAADRTPHHSAQPCWSSCWSSDRSERAPCWSSDRSERAPIPRAACCRARRPRQPEIQQACTFATMKCSHCHPIDRIVVRARDRRPALAALHRADAAEAVERDLAERRRTSCSGACSSSKSLASIASKGGHDQHPACLHPPASWPLQPSHRRPRRSPTRPIATSPDRSSSTTWRSPSESIGRRIALDSATAEASLKVTQDFGDQMSASVKLCVACHGVEVAWRSSICASPTS